VLELELLVSLLTRRQPKHQHSSQTANDSPVLSTAYGVLRKTRQTLLDWIEYTVTTTTTTATSAFHPSSFVLLRPHRQTLVSHSLSLCSLLFTLHA
jgi:hypothetical protein